MPTEAYPRRAKPDPEDPADKRIDDKGQLHKLRQVAESVKSLAHKAVGQGT